MHSTHLSELHNIHSAFWRETLNVNDNCRHNEKEPKLTLHMCSTVKCLDHAYLILELLYFTTECSINCYDFVQNLRRTQNNVPY